MSEAKMIPQCGHMFLNILDEICFVLTRIFRDVPLPHGFNEYTPVDTARAPLVLSGRTGFDPHLVAEAYKRNSLDTAAMDSLRATVISPLKLEFEISKVLVHWRLAIAGDCDAIRQLTGIKTTPKFLAEMVKRQIDKLRTSQALKANIYRSQTQGLRGTSALASGDGLGEGNEAIESASSHLEMRPSGAHTVHGGDGWTTVDNGGRRLRGEDVSIQDPKAAACQYLLENYRLAPVIEYQRPVTVSAPHPFPPRAAAGRAG
jgi:hypothetical protein